MIIILRAYELIKKTSTCAYYKFACMYALEVKILHNYHSVITFVWFFWELYF